MCAHHSHIDICLAGMPGLEVLGTTATPFWLGADRQKRAPAERIHDDDDDDRQTNVACPTYASLLPG